MKQKVIIIKHWETNIVMTGLTLIQEFIWEENVGCIIYFPNRYFEKKILVGICTCWELHFNRAFIIAFKSSDYKM